MSIEALKELLGRRTPGRWFIVGPPWNEGAPWINSESEDPHQGSFVCDLLRHEHEESPRSEENAAAICALSNAADELVAVAETLGFVHVVVRNLQGYDNGFCPMCHAADIEDAGVHTDGCLLGDAVAESASALAKLDAALEGEGT